MTSKRKLINVHVDAAEHVVKPRRKSEYFLRKKQYSNTFQAPLRVTADTSLNRTDARCWSSYLAWNSRVILAIEWSEKSLDCNFRRICGEKIITRKRRYRKQQITGSSHWFLICGISQSDKLGESGRWY